MKESKKREKIFIENTHHINEWNFNRNTDLIPSEMTIGSHKKVWWICSEGHEWQAVIYSKKEKGCPFCSGRMPTKESCLSATHPELSREWHTSKNGDLTPNKVSAGSGKKVWWSCKKCGSDYDAYISNRARLDTGCSYCSSIKINHTNSLAVLNPKLAKEWHLTKNKGLTSFDVSPKSGKSAWWIGQCGHEWKAAIESRNNGCGCPICNNKKVLIGYNDMWTTNSELARLLLNPEDGYKYTQSSSKKLDWKCIDCGYINKNKSISSAYRSLKTCPNCSDGFKYPEKFMHNLLNLCGLVFEYQKTFDWLDNRIYDFYIPSMNMIIETHGRQHYLEYNFGSKSSRSLKDEQENDKLKEKIAKENGIENYIIIDCRRSETSFIKRSILNSPLKDFLNFEKVDWKIIVRNSSKSILPEISSYYNENKNKMTQNEMSINLGISLGTLKSYLKKGAEAGICDYFMYDKKRRKLISRQLGKPVIQISLDGTFVAEWFTITDATKSLGKSSPSNITSVCTGKQKTAYGYKWMYKEEYEKLNKTA